MSTAFTMTNSSAYERMRAGQLYTMPDQQLIDLQVEARDKLDAFNATSMADMQRRRSMLQEMLGSTGMGTIVSPVTWEYGRHIYLGERFFINFDCVFLDGADVRIGTNAVIGPRVQLLTAGHPLDPVERAWLHPETGKRQGTYCINKPITIGENCWIGAGVIILGGVTIGEGSTIGAGSVVTRNIPPGVLAAGNPCRVIRPIAADAQAVAVG